MPNAYGYPEADWRTFRELMQVALQRFCQRTIDEVRSVASDRAAPPLEIYRRIYRLVHARDDELALMFDDVRRSTMTVKLLAIYRQGLLEPDEFARFSEGTRERILWMHDTFGAPR